MKKWPFLAMAVTVLTVASCGSPTNEEGGSGSTTTTRITTTSGHPRASSPTETLSAKATVSPDQGVAGTTFTFTVIIRGPGTLNGEEVQFGDGGTSGANAGEIACGATARVDHTSVYTHIYEAAGTYTFRDVISVLGPAPSCDHEQTTASVVLIVAAPLSSATLNGAFMAPSTNIACIIYSPDGKDTVRCASFAPPRLVTMDSTGAYQTCTGSKCELGNPAAETPVLPYGSATGDGTYQCLSSTVGMTCTIVGRIGFRISRSGVESVP
jgi:hypothetical protein